MDWLIRMLSWIGMYPALGVMILIQKIHMPREWATGNDSSCTAYGLLSLFFGIIILIGLSILIIHQII
jgi:hypothetical protein